MEKEKKSRDKDIKKKNLPDDTLKRIEKQFGKGSIMRLGDHASVEIDATFSGSIKVDEALGIGGYPKGRIMEIYGPEFNGKTMLALHAIAEVQKKDRRAALINAENATNPTYAKNLGVNIDDLIPPQPDSEEQALDITKILIESGAIDLVVIDSVVAPMPQAELDGEMRDIDAGLQARMISKAMWKLGGIMNRSERTAIFISQLREKVGITFGNPETMPGGRALKFYSSVRPDIRCNEAIKNSTDIVGNKVNIRVVKNKVAPPFKITQVKVMYDGGISYVAELLDLCVDHDIVIESGIWFSYNSKKIGQGKEAAKTFTKSNPALTEELGAKLRGKTIPKEAEVSEEEKEEAQVSSFSADVETLT